MKKFLSALLVLSVMAAAAANAAPNDSKNIKSDDRTGQIESVFFSPPVGAYAGLRTLFWSYRVSQGSRIIPEKVSCSIPELKIYASVDVKTGEYRKEWIRTPDAMVPGKYKVIMKALDKNGKVLLEKSSVLTVINRPEYGKNFPVKSVAVDPEGNMLVNGRKTLINGVYNAYYPDGIRSIAQAGFNTSKVSTENPDICKRILKALETSAIYADCRFKNISSKNADLFMKLLKDHPAVLILNIAGKTEISNIPIGKFPLVILKIRADEPEQSPHTAEQIRSGAYSALINGAKGLWWDNYRAAYRMPHIWGALTLLNSELFELESVILGKRTMLATSLKAVEAAVFTDGKRTVVIAVNTGKVEAKPLFSGIPGKTLTELFTGNAAVSVMGGKVKFTVAPESTRIFEVK